MRLKFLSLLAAAALLSVGGAARADYQFQFTDSSGTVSSAFTVAQGSTVDLRVYLLETNGGTTLTDTGLSSAGVKLTYDGSIAAVANPAAIVPNLGTETSITQFNSADKSTTANSASLNLYQDAAGGTGVKATDNRVLLGTFTFTGMHAGSTLTLTTDPSGLGDTTLGDDNGTVIDSMIANSSAVITVTAVPEPGTLLLTGLFGAGMGLAALRRRRAHLSCGG